MSVKVLKSESEIRAARDALRLRGASCLGSRLGRTLRRLGWIGGINVGDHIKSWDVFATLDFLQVHAAKDSPILDIGSYASEILCALHRVHFTDLTGIDLNPAVTAMPHRDVIRYEVADFRQTPFDGDSFGAVTAISVIEHGFHSQRLLREVGRLLRIGGFFIASFDYWPEKVDTTGIDLFGMEWKIFSRSEVHAFLDEARSYDLLPFGDVDLDAEERVIHWGGKDYTFAWLALRKNR